MKAERVLSPPFSSRMDVIALIVINWDTKCTYPTNIMHFQLFLHQHEPNSTGFEQIIKAFGKEVVGEDGQINRRALGSIVFTNKGRSKSTVFHKV